MDSRGNTKSSAFFSLALKVHDVIAVAFIDKTVVEIF
jgi:hypothetical protein